MQVFSIYIDDALAARLDEASQRLDLNQAEILQDAIQGKIEELEEMAEVMAILQEQGTAVPGAGVDTPASWLWQYKG